MRQGYKQTDLGVLPIDWEIKTIGELADVTAGGTPSTNRTEYWNGTIPWMNSGEINLRRIKSVDGRITELGLKNSSTKFIPAYSVLIALAGQGKTRGKVAVNEFELCTNQSLAAIMPHTSLHHEFLFQNLESRYKEIRRLSTGDGGRGGLNLAIIRSIKLALPPLPEQQKIAEILSTVDEKIDVIAEQIVQTQELKKGLMQRLLTKGISHTQFKESPFGKIPESWYIDFLAASAKVIDSLHQTPSFVEAGYPMVRVGDIKGIKLDLNRCLHVSYDIYNEFIRNYIPRRGDILMTRVGTFGASVIVETDELFCIGQNTVIINPSNNSKFLYYFLNSDMVKKQMNKNTNGSSQKSLSLKDIKQLLICLPCIEEQQEIAKVLSTIDEKLDILQDKKSQYQVFKTGLMQQLLTGKLRVNHLIEQPELA